MVGTAAIFTNPALKITNKQPFAAGYKADILLAELDDGLNHKEKVAIKVVRVTLDNVAARNALRANLEARMGQWVALEHPNLVKFLGLSYEYPFPTGLVSPFFANGNANDYLKRFKGKHPEDPALVANKMLQVIRGAARGLQHLHTQSPAIIHGAVRACNILLDETESPRLVDFGLMAALDSIITNFTTADFVGPIRWYAPEILYPEGEEITYNVKTDVFSFSMMCIEVITGKRPFAHRRLDAAVLSDIPLMMLCWAQDPSERPDQISEVEVVANLKTVRVGFELASHKRVIIALGNDTYQFLSRLHCWDAENYSRASPCLPRSPALLPLTIYHPTQLSPGPRAFQNRVGVLCQFFDQAAHAIGQPISRAHVFTIRAFPASHHLATSTRNASTPTLSQNARGISLNDWTPLHTPWA
ncbi:kinase-like protein [Athelia psychrophila]|uniref:Kinase-like protein n=1 Tax=Athelia psychrophila TaxID=1759441 RepID=A0A166F662_9AGAM|nr:kinase-like protein [Fibularhizoctonia sp. CBS 109695]